MEVNITYIHPPKNDGISLFAAIPAGIFGIVNHLREHGYDVRGINIPMEISLDRNFTIIDALAEKPLPHIIIMDLHWYEHTYGAIETAKSIKKEFSNTIIILGGLTASIFAADIIRTVPEIDYIIRGEAEDPLLNLVNALVENRDDRDSISGLVYRNKSDLVENSIRFTRDETNFDHYNYVDFEWLDNYEKYVRLTPSGTTHAHTNFWLLIGSGCPFDCSYCGGGRQALLRAFNKSKSTLRSTDQVAKDMQALAAKQIEVINPTIDLAITPRSYWEELFHQLKTRNVHVGMYLELFQLPSPPFLKQFSKTFDLAKSILVYTPLTANKAMRRFNGKYFSNNDFISSVAMCREAGINIEICFTENLPGIKKKDLSENQALIQKVRNIHPNAGIMSQEIALDPYSNMAADPDKYGIIRHFSTLEDYYTYSSGCRSEGYHPNGYELAESS